MSVIRYTYILYIFVYIAEISTLYVIRYTYIPYTSLISSLCNFLHSPVTSSLLGPNTFLNTLFSNTLSLTFLSDLYSLPNIVRVVKSRRMRWVGHVARMGEGRGVYRVLVGKPEGKEPLGRPRRRWENNIKMDLQEVGGGCGDWMELAQDRDRWRALVSTVMNFRVPKMWGIS